MLSFCSFLDNFWQSSLAGKAWVSEQAIRVSFPILDVPKNWIQPQLKLCSWFNVQMLLAYLCFSQMPCITQTRLEGPDFGGQGGEEFSGVHPISMSQVVEGTSWACRGAAALWTDAQADVEDAQVRHNFQTHGVMHLGLNAC